MSDLEDQIPQVKTYPYTFYQKFNRNAEEKQRFEQTPNQRLFTWRLQHQPFKKFNIPGYFKRVEDERLQHRNSLAQQRATQMKQLQAQKLQDPEKKMTSRERFELKRIARKEQDEVLFKKAEALMAFMIERTKQVQQKVKQTGKITKIVKNKELINFINQEQRRAYSETRAQQSEMLKENISAEALDRKGYSLRKVLSSVPQEKLQKIIQEKQKYFLNTLFKLKDVAVGIKDLKKTIVPKINLVNADTLSNFQQAIPFMRRQNTSSPSESLYSQSSLYRRIKSQQHTIHTSRNTLSTSPRGDQTSSANFYTSRGEKAFTQAEESMPKASVHTQPLSERTPYSKIIELSPQRVNSGKGKIMRHDSDNVIKVQYCDGTEEDNEQQQNLQKKKQMRLIQGREIKGALEFTKLNRRSWGGEQYIEIEDEVLRKACCEPMNFTQFIFENKLQEDQSQQAAANVHAVDSVFRLCNLHTIFNSKDYFRKRYNNRKGFFVSSERGVLRQEKELDEKLATLFEDIDKVTETALTRQ